MGDRTAALCRGRISNASVRAVIPSEVASEKTRLSGALEARDAPTSPTGLERDNAVPAAGLVYRSQTVTGRG